jgi:peptide/nickel transport system substrate-binding protein
MKWSDGSPVTIDDAVFSLQAPGFGDKSPMYRPFVLNIANVETTGPNSLRITLKRPDAAFLVTTLSKLNLASKAEWAPIFASLQGKPETAESIAQQTRISSGPYRMVKAQLDQEIVLEPNPEHWAAPKAGRWIMRVQPDIQAALGAMKSGEINFLADYTGDPALLDDLAKANPNISVDKSLDLGIRFIGYNARRPPFNDPKFRAALSAAIDRQTIADDAYGGEAVPSNSWVSPALKFWADPGITDRLPGGGTLEGAKKLLQEAGYTLVGGKLHYPAGVKETTQAFQ